MLTPNHIYTLKDLKNWDRKEPSLAVVGHPVKHSLSPQMHNSILPTFEKTKNWQYFKFDIKPQELEEAIALFHEKNFVGLNITLPHKRHVIKFVTSIDPNVRKIEAVNTLLRNDEGYAGYNTDAEGLEIAVGKQLGTKLADNFVLLLGAGGSARAGAVQCIIKGVKHLWVANRSKRRLDDLVKALKNINSEIDIRGFPLTEIPLEELPHKTLVINATSLGIKSHDPSPIQLSSFKKGTKVFDMTYFSEQSALCKQASDMHMEYANGLSMLIEQGAISFKLWTGNEPSTALMEKAIYNTTPKK